MMHSKSGRSVSSRSRGSQRLNVNHRRSLVLQLACAGVLAAAPVAEAVNVYWDTNGASGGSSSGTTANGAWDAGTTGNWSTNSAGTVATGNYATSNGGSPSTADVFFSAGTNATGATTITLTATANAGPIANSITVEEGTINFNTSGTFGAGPALSLGSGGLTFANTSTGGSTTNATTIGLSASQTWTNNSSGSFTHAGNLSLAGNALTISGSGNMALNNPITGVGGSIVKSSAGLLSIGQNGAANTFTGGLTINTGTVFFDENSTVSSGAITQGVFGTGLVTMASGTTLDRGGTSRTIHNSFDITGSVTFTSSNLGSWTNLNYFAVTSPSAGTFTLHGDTTIAVNYSGNNSGSLNGLVITGRIVGADTPSLTIRGVNNSTASSVGIVTLNNTSGSASTFGNLTIGETVSSGSAGGTARIVNQNSVGSGSISVNYGGQAHFVTSSFSPTNVINVANGGILNIGIGATNFNFFSATGGTTLSSGAALANTSGFTMFANNGTGANQISLPTAGVLLNNGSNIVGLNGAFPAFTGTLALGGTGSNNLTLGSSSTATSGAQSLAFNQVGAAAVFSGLNLGGDLTLTGTGAAGYNGVYGQGSGGSIGVITQTGGARPINVNLAPYAVTSMSSTAAGPISGLTISSGVLAVDPGNTVGIKAGGTVTLNGGTIRSQNGSNNNATWQDSITVSSAGGTIETFALNNAQTVTYTGAITGSGALTLRTGGVGNNNSSILLSPTASSAYDGAITVTTSSGRGRVQFNSNSLASLSAGEVTVAEGAVFGVDSYSTLTANIAKFTTNTDSILAIDNSGTIFSTVNLSNTGGGLNRDVRVGGQGTVTSGATFTPYGDTYNITPASGTITVNQNSWLTGAKNLDVRAGVFAPGATGVATGTLNLNGTQDYTGNTTVLGQANNAIAGGTTTGTTVVISGTITASGGLTAGRGATVSLAGAGGQMSSVSAVSLHGGGLLRIGDTTTASNNNGVANRINSGANLVMGGTDGGGTLTLAYGTTSHSQTFNRLTVNSGSNVLNTVNTATGSATLTFAGGADYVRNVGARLAMGTNTNFNIVFTAAPTGSSVSQVTANPILIGAFMGADLVAAQSGNWTAAAYTNQLAGNLWGTSGNENNINVTGNVTGTVGNATINSLRINGDPGTINIGAANTLNIASGMIYIPSMGSARSILGGTITTGNSQDLILNNAGSDLTIGSTISASGLAITKIGTGAVALSGTNNAFGDVHINGGELRISATGAMPTGTTRTVYLSGGVGSVLRISAPGNFTNTSFVVASTGGNLNTNANGAVSFGGDVTLNGTFGLGSPGGGSPTTTTFSGTVSGPGFIGVGKQSDGRNFTVLTGNNANWSGGIRFDQLYANSGSGYSYVRFAPSQAGYDSAGSGAIVTASGNPAGGVIFDTTNSGTATFDNNIHSNFGQLPIAAWGLSSGLGTGSANNTILSGSIIGGTGVIFQGYATSDTAISELVLAGIVQVSGTSGGYSYGSTTVAQNFNNGQGGITLGQTNYRGTTLQGPNGTSGLGELPSGAVINGAEGFVRFDGVKSFIPGAVGPGYIAAIRRAGSGKDGQFGYLVTGGSTYTLPEGKSFVIGSLGTGTQQYGTLGVSGGSATLLGSGKLAGFAAGDVNIHANAASDSQSLNLFARNAADTLVLGSVNTGVIFTPTYGDSGVTSTITLMAARTGTTTINTIGAGTVEFVNAHFNALNGAADSAKSGITLNVNSGTLKYTQVDTGSSYAAVNVNSGGTLAGSGAINGAVSVASGGVLSPGTSPGILSTGSLAMAGGAEYRVELTGTAAVAGTDYDQTAVTGSLSLGGATLNLVTTGLTLSDNQFFTIILNDGTLDASGTTFLNAAEGDTLLTQGDYQLKITYYGENNALAGIGSGNDVGLYTSAVPEPASLGLLALGGAGMLSRRRRRRA